MTKTQKSDFQTRTFNLNRACGALDPLVLFLQKIQLVDVKMPAATALIEEQVKVVAKIAIDSLPISNKALEDLLERNTKAIENAADSFRSLEHPFRFCLYCIGVSVVILSGSFLIKSLRKSSKGI